MVRVCVLCLHKLGDIGKELILGIHFRCCFVSLTLIHTGATVLHTANYQALERVARVYTNDTPTTHVPTLEPG